MKRLILASALLAAGAVGLLAQPTTASPPAAAAPKGPAPKSQAELTALQAWQAAIPGDPDALIKTCDDLLAKFPDTDFKESVLVTEAGAYQRKKDLVHAQIFAESALKTNPKSYQASLLLADVLQADTHEHDLDSAEKLAKIDTYAKQTVELINAATKPPQLSDDQWADAKKGVAGQVYRDVALANMTCKKWDPAIAAFRLAIASDPQPAYRVQMASCLQSQGKNDEAIALCDQVLAEPNLHPAIKAAATNIKDIATKAKGK